MRLFCCKGRFVLMCGALCLFFVGCNHDPIGSISDQRRIVVFSILNPAIRTQRMIVQQSLTFDEGQSNILNNSEISGILGTLSTTDADYEIIEMPAAGRSESESEGTHLDTDFLAGSQRYNYILDGPPIESGKTYQLSLSHADYETVFAEATVPGPFEITEISIEPQYSLDNLILDIDDWSSFSNKYKPENFRVAWSESENAAGYWLDITILEYDIPPDLRLDLNAPDFWPNLDSTKLADIPYREYPVHFELAEENSVRGFLTLGNSFEMPINDFIELVDLPKDFDYRFEHTYRMRVYVHALSQELYNYFLEGSATGETIGEVKTIPNLSFIENGYGVFGAALTRSATARLYDYILGLEYASAVPGEFLYWYAQFNDVYSLDQILNDDFSRLLFPTGIEAPALLSPANETVLSPDNNLVLSWDAIENTANYIVVLKPSYLWFKPGNVVFVTDENRLEISWQNIPYKDCQIEWYVKAISSIDDAEVFVLEVPPDKAPLIYVNAITSPWSESRYLQTGPGDVDGFENQVPNALSPLNGETVGPTGALSWQEVPAADAYLVFLTNEQDEHALAVTTEPLVSPPFPDENSPIEGLIGLSQFQQGLTYRYQVCALRVRAGALGFTIAAPSGNAPPTISPRHEHPSGIMLQSRWSESIEFQVQ